MPQPQRPHQRQQRRGIGGQQRRQPQGVRHGRTHPAVIPEFKGRVAAESCGEHHGEDCQDRRQPPDLPGHAASESGQLFLRPPPFRPREVGGDQAYGSSCAQHRPQQVESLHLPNVLIQAVKIIVEAGLSAAVQLEIRHRLLPDGHVDGHIRRVLPGREILIAGDVPQGILCKKSIAVNVHWLSILGDGDCTVLKGQQKVVALRHGPAGGEDHICWSIAVIGVLPRSLDPVEEILVLCIGGVWRLLFRGCYIFCGSVRGSPLVPGDASTGHDVGIPGSSIPPLQVAAGGHSQKGPQPLGHLLPEGWGLLPVCTPPSAAEGAAVDPAGQAARRLSQAPQHQAHAQYQGRQSGRRPQPAAGLSGDADLRHARGVLHPLQSLPDLPGHKLFQTFVRSRAVPFCIQCPTPP